MGYILCEKYVKISIQLHFVSSLIIVSSKYDSHYIILAIKYILLTAITLHKILSDTFVQWLKYTLSHQLVS